jgi:sensor histidine kinase regulating citrate/malate metabolism
VDQNNLCREVVGLYREDRHDFLNHLQIILGYLQLNKEEKAIAYIKEIYQEIQEISIITRLKNPYLVIALLLVLQKSKHYDIKLSFQVEQSLATLEGYQENITDRLSIFLNHVLGFLHENFPAGENQVEVAFQEDTGHHIWVMSLPHGIDLETMVYEWNNQPELAYLKQECCRVEVLESENKVLVYHALTAQNILVL